MDVKSKTQTQKDYHGHREGNSLTEVVQPTDHFRQQDMTVETSLQYELSPFPVNQNRSEH